MKRRLKQTLIPLGVLAALAAAAAGGHHAYMHKLDKDNRAAAQIGQDWIELQPIVRN